MTYPPDIPPPILYDGHGDPMTPAVEHRATINILHAAGYWEPHRNVYVAVARMAARLYTLEQSLGILKDIIGDGPPRNPFPPLT